MKEGGLGDKWTSWWVGRRGAGGGGRGWSPHYHAAEHIPELLSREITIHIDVHGVKLVADGCRELRQVRRKKICGR